MFRKFSVFALFATLLGCAPALSAQQPSLCAPVDDAALGLLDYARDLAQASAADEKMAATAEAYGILQTPVDQVTISSDAHVCAKAARRFNQEAGRHGKVTRPVYVIQIGTAKNQERYIVVDPTESAGEYGVAMVFDAHFKHIISFTH